jgi:hydrogenase maturation factor HypE
LPELASFLFFDERITTQVKKEMIDNLNSNNFNIKITEQTKISDLINSKTHEFLKELKINVSFLTFSVDSLNVNQKL